MVKLDEYLTVCSVCDPSNMHFFDESSVIKTTGNRNYGHVPVGQRAIEIQRYVSNQLTQCTYFTAFLELTM